VGGFTKSTTKVADAFPITYDAAQSVYGGAGDGFYQILNHNASKILYCTYLGGDDKDGDTGSALADWYNNTLDVSFITNNIYFAGATQSEDNILYNPPPCTPPSPCMDTFVDESAIPDDDNAGSEWNCYFAKYEPVCNKNSDAFEPNNDLLLEYPTLPFSPIHHGVEITGVIDSEVDVDYFRIVSPFDSGLINITLTSPQQEFYVMELIGSVVSGLLLSDSLQSICLSIPADSVFTIMVRGATTADYDSSLCYTLALQGNYNGNCRNGDFENFAAARLLQNIPNPFYGETVIRYNVPAAWRNHFIRVTDLLGSVVEEIPLAQGSSSVQFNSGKLNAGVYFYSLYHNNQKLDTRRMMISQ
jgi:hypothetical protein